MDETESLLNPEVVLPVTDTVQMLLRFAFNAVVTWFIIHFLYYTKSKRRDYYFTYMIISVSIFFLIFLLGGGVKLKVGVALGLFAIFSIIRYRTEQMPVREMTYLFALIALSCINALATAMEIGQLLATNGAFILFFLLGENMRWMGVRHVAGKLILYDRVDLIVPEKRQELLADLQKRTGLTIRKVELGAIDFLRDTVILKVYYDADGDDQNTVDRMLKLPKPTDV